MYRIDFPIGFSFLFVPEPELSRVSVTYPQEESDSCNIERKFVREKHIRWTNVHDGTSEFRFACEREK